MLRPYNRNVQFYFSMIHILNLVEFALNEKAVRTWHCHIPSSELNAAFRELVLVVTKSVFAVISRGVQHYASTGMMYIHFR